jgi:hypothetical protein
MRTLGGRDVYAAADEVEVGVWRARWDEDGESEAEVSERARELVDGRRRRTSEQSIA